MDLLLVLTREAKTMLLFGGGRTGSGRIVLAGVEIADVDGGGKPSVGVGMGGQNNALFVVVMIWGQTELLPPASFGVAGVDVRGQYFACVGHGG